MAQKMATVEVLSGFILPGRKPAEVGERLTLPEGFARELLAAHKVKRVLEVRTDPLVAQIPRGPDLATQTPKLETPEPVSPGRRFKA